jgi:ABC-type transport system involved in cytochrome bd biosynthesis fused ATPase/permease subunit
VYRVRHLREEVPVRGHQHHQSAQESAGRADPSIRPKLVQASSVSTSLLSACHQEGPEAAPVAHALQCLRSACRDENLPFCRLPMPRPGQVLGLVGTNGIGKSTALKVLGGKLKPNLGRCVEPG